jgi:hypothetical protein
MSNGVIYYFIWGAANDNEWVIDIQGASSASGTALDAFPVKPACNDNQQWEVVPSSVVNPGGSGTTVFYFIKSKLNGKNVITANGTSLEASEQKSPASDDQLWQLSDGSLKGGNNVAYTIIQNANGNVITIPEGTKKSNTKLQLAPLSGGPNQQWGFMSGTLAPPGFQSTP